MSRTGAGERLARLLSIVPWIVAQDGPSVAEVCQRFGLSERELVADLELLFMCGAYPYTPDSLIDVDIDEGRVWVRFADWFRRPLRLSAPEGLALVAAARAMLETVRPGAGTDMPEPVGDLGAASRQGKPEKDGGPRPLISALAKLETALGLGNDGAVQVQLGAAPPDLLAQLRDATSERWKVVIEYYSFGRDATTKRVVHPWQVFSSEGHWYLLAWCELVQDRRLFRLDRIGSARALPEHFAAPKQIGPLQIFQSRPDHPLVVLDVAPEARWLVDQYPTESVVAGDDGHVQLSLRASSTAWLERLLLRAGPAVRVISGAQGVREAAARRVLARYMPVSSKR